MFTQQLKKYFTCFLLQFISLAYILRNYAYYILCQAKLKREIQNAHNLINLTGLVTLIEPNVAF
jgi:hypothetical protein